MKKIKHPGTSWWIPPIWKEICARQIGSFSPRLEVKFQQTFELPPPRGCFMLIVSSIDRKCLQPFSSNKGASWNFREVFEATHADMPQVEIRVPPMSFRLILLVVQKSGEKTESMLVLYPIMLQGFIHPRWLAGFLNHQQYRFSPFITIRNGVVLH